MNYANITLHRSAFDEKKSRHHENSWAIIIRNHRELVDASEVEVINLSALMGRIIFPVESRTFYLFSITYLGIATLKWHHPHWQTRWYYQMGRSSLVSQRRNDPYPRESLRLHCIAKPIKEYRACNLWKNTELAVYKRIQSLQSRAVSNNTVHNNTAKGQFWDVANTKLWIHSTG